MPKSTEHNQLLEIWLYSFLHCIPFRPKFDPCFHCQKFTPNQYITKGFLFANVKSQLIFFGIQQPYSFSFLNINGRVVKANSCPSIIFFHYSLQTVTCSYKFTLNWTGWRSSVQGQAPWNSMKLCIAGNRGFNLCAKSHKTGSSGLSIITLLLQLFPRLFVTFADWKKKNCHLVRRTGKKCYNLLTTWTWFTEVLLHWHIQ